MFSTRVRGLSARHMMCSNCGKIRGMYCAISPSARTRIGSGAALGIACPPGARCQRSGKGTSPTTGLRSRLAHDTGG